MDFADKKKTMGFNDGFKGALAFTALLATGVALGWMACKTVARHSKPDLPQPEERERKRLEEEQKAFRHLQNYSTEQAYGMVGGDS